MSNEAVAHMSVTGPSIRLMHWCYVTRCGSGGKSCRLAVGGLPVRSHPGRVEVSLSETPNPQLFLTSWLVPCMAANRHWCVNVCVDGWMRGINCTALWINAVQSIYLEEGQVVVEPQCMWSPSSPEPPCSRCRLSQGSGSDPLETPGVSAGCWFLGKLLEKEERWECGW